MRGDDVYILDTSDNTIIKYTKGIVSRVIELDNYGVIGTNIAVYNGDVFVLCTDINVYRISNQGVISNLGIREYLLSEGFSDFRIIDGFLYICVAEEDIVTYKFDVRDVDEVNMVLKFTGMVYDNSTIFYSTPIVEAAKKDKSGIRVTVTHLDSRETETFDVYSDYGAFGAQYLGKDENGNNRVLFFEIAQNADYTIASASSMRVLDEEDKLIGVRELEKQVKSVPNQIKVIDGEVYFLNSQSDKVEILGVKEPDSSTASTHSSSLKAVVGPKFDQERSVMATITRNKIMSNAISYHTSYSWTCSSANLTYLSGWTCPSYVTGAGTYTCMPYCWGKFDNQSLFATKLGWAYRVGNVSTTYTESTCGLDCSGYVSRCWELGEHHYTGALYNVADEIEYYELLRGDALNSADHVMLFDGINTSNGSYIFYECTTTNHYDRVAHTSRTLESISNIYTPIRYDNVS